jgi:hypothetical protein
MEDRDAERGSEAQQIQQWEMVLHGTTSAS